MECKNEILKIMDVNGLDINETRSALATRQVGSIYHKSVTEQVWYWIRLMWSGEIWLGSNPNPIQPVAISLQNGSACIDTQNDYDWSP